MKTYRDTTRTVINCAEDVTSHSVNVSRWGNTCPRISVPEGWEDHQHTQQLVRKTIRNEFARLDFATRRLFIELDKEDRKVMFEPIYGLNKYLFLTRTIRGLNIDVLVREHGDQDLPLEEKIGGCLGTYSYLSKECKTCAAVNGRCKQGWCRYHSVSGYDGIINRIVFIIKD